MFDYKSYISAYNIIAIIIGIIGLIYLIYNLWKNIRTNTILSWPKINATVLSAVAKPVNQNSGSFIDPRYVVASTDNITQYIPVVVYKYRVNGVDYQSNNVMYYGPSTYNGLDIKTLMAPIYPGAIINIFYNPNNPNEAYIYNGIKNYKGTIIGIILLIIAAAIFYYDRRKGSENNIIKKKWRNKNTSPNLTEIEQQYSKKYTYYDM